MMKKVLLMYPDMLFYKISIFNKLSRYLEERGYKLIIWYRKVSDPNHECSFSYISGIPLNLKNYEMVLREHNIDAVINILFKKDPGYLFYFLSILKTRSLGIPIIFYGHGIDKQKDQWLRNLIYNLTHLLFDGIILYTPAERQKLWKRFHNKITCANNTLDIDNIVLTESKEHLKSRYNITAQKVILTTGRLHKRKRIGVMSDIFIRNFSNSPDVAWVLVGPDLSEEVTEAIKGISNVHFLGPVYDRKKMAEIFSMADLYCVPGALGLGIVEAFYWGLPVLTMAVNHGPEAYYLRDGTNSLIAKDKRQLEQMLLDILYNDEKRSQFSDNARETYFKEATLDKMFEGFSRQLERVLGAGEQRPESRRKGNKMARIIPITTKTYNNETISAKY